MMIPSTTRGYSEACDSWRQALEELIARANLTLPAVARAAGKDRNSVFRYVRGKASGRAPSVAAIQSINAGVAKALGHPPAAAYLDAIFLLGLPPGDGDEHLDPFWGTFIDLMLDILDEEMSDSRCDEMAEALLSLDYKTRRKLARLAVIETRREMCWMFDEKPRNRGARNPIDMMRELLSATGILNKAWPSSNSAETDFRFSLEMFRETVRNAVVEATPDIPTRVRLESDICRALHYVLSKFENYKETVGHRRWGC